MKLENIIVDKKEIGKLVGAAKRVWTGAKTERVAVDKIERAESALFANDLTLARLAKQKQLIDRDITEHIDTVLRDSRGYDATELATKKEGALLELLKDSLHQFDTLEGLRASDNKIDETKRPVWNLEFSELRQRLGNMIKEMEGEI